MIRLSQQVDRTGQIDHAIRPLKTPDTTLVPGHRSSARRQRQDQGRTERERKGAVHQGQQDRKKAKISTKSPNSTKLLQLLRKNLLSVCIK
jgi:hypothetical protein